MMIHKDKCFELGLPEPKSFDTQLAYILKVITLGMSINTRDARYIGIHNLHSIPPKLHKKGYPYTLEHGRVNCPFTGKTPSNSVDILSMTPEQISNYQKTKTAKKG